MRDRIEGTLFHSLASFAASVDLENVPKEVPKQAKLCILDTVGCILAGSISPEGQAFLRAEKQLSHGLAVKKLSPVSLGHVLAYWGDVFELNDLVGGHGSIGNVTPALLGAHLFSASGADLVRGVIAGLEITCRIQRTTSQDKRSFEEFGNISISLANAMGGAAGVSVLAHLSEEEIANAIAIAGAIANWGPAEVIFGDGGTIKPTQFGSGPTDHALHAAVYAKHGITGPPRLLESRMGLLATCCHSYDPTILTSNDTWYLPNPQRKLHACCGFTHSAIDAICELYQNGTDFSSAERIELCLPERVIDSVVKPHFPRTSNEARFDIKYVSALAANGTDVIVPAHTVNFEEYFGNPEIPAIMEKIVIKEIDPERLKNIKVFNDMYNESAVNVVYADGTVIQGGCSAPRGSAKNPLTEEQVANKFRQLTQDKLDANTIEDVISRMLNLEEQADCNWIYNLLIAVVAED